MYYILYILYILYYILYIIQLSNKAELDIANYHEV